MSHPVPTANYRRTMHASYLGYGAQAIANNFAPLLFITFESTLGIDLQQLATLISVLFGTQLVVDVLASRYAERIGYRISIMFATIMCAIGLAGLGILPNLLGGNPMLGLGLATVLYAIGGGLIEVLVSPIVQGTPSDQPDQAMSGLHTSYSFAQVAVVLISTLFFVIFGRDSWPWLACLWALVPLASAVLFARAPLPVTVAEEPEQAADGKAKIPFYKRRAFYVFIIVMMGGGACEMAMGQWASAFSESTLGLSKTMGDLVGPTAFALMMGASRLFYTKWGCGRNVGEFLLFSLVIMP